MKKLLVSLAGAALLLAACTPQELSNQALKDRLDQQDQAIAALQGDVNELKTAVSQINANISALQAVVTALQSNVYVKEVTPIKDGDSNVIGYTIQFTDNTSVAIYHGEKGDKGDKGDQGETGAPGAPGADGTTPVIGVQEYAGALYWTVNGEWLKDAQGKLVPVTGNDGAAGAPGQDGKTPQLRINEGNWEVSYDGQTWTVVGPAQTAAESVDVVFKGVKETKDQVIFTLADDTKLAIDKLVEFSLKLDDTQVYEVVEGKSTLVPYTLSGAGKSETRVDAVASGDWWAEVVADNNDSGAVKVIAGTTDKAKVIVYAVDGKGRSDMRSLIFEGGSLVATAPVEESPVDGGEVIVPVVTNVNYTVDIEESAQYWISYAITKAEVRTDKLVLTVEKNTLPETRSGWVRLRDVAGALIQEFEVKQESGVYEIPTFEDSSFKNWVLYSSAAADYNEDGKVNASEAAKLTELTINSEYTSLKGIECFYNLKKITINKATNLASVDLSQNKKLQEVTISKSGTPALATVNLSDLHALKSVQMGGMTSVTSLELGSAPALTSLMVWNTAIEALDVTKAPALTNLAVYGTKLTKLDLSNNTALLEASLGATTLASVKLPDEPKLTKLNLDNAALTELDLSKLTELVDFSAAATKLVNIDLSGSAKLAKFAVGSLGGSNKSTVLKKVDIRKAGSLSSVNLYSDALEEVIVLKGTKTSSWNWTSYHMNPETGATTYVTVTEVEGEGGDEPEVGDYAEGIKEAFVKKLILGKFDKNGDGAIDETEAAAVTELDLSECGLEDGDLAGLEVFPIAKLLLNGNKFTQFDVLAWPKLEWLNLNDNKLTALSIGTSSSALKQNLHLEAANNQISKFTGPSYSAKVSYIDLSNNQLTSFSMPYCSVVTYVDVSNNMLASVNLSSASALTEVNVSNNQISSVAFNGFAKLVKANVSHNKLTAYSFGASQTALEEVDMSYNNIASIDITSIAKAPANFKLKKIDLTGNENFNLVIVGGGNKMPEGLELLCDGEYNILDAATPSGYAYNNGNNIKSQSVDDKAQFGDITLNYSLKTKGFKIADGGKATIVAKAGKRRLVFFAAAVEGTPQITLARSSGKAILTADTDTSPFGASYKASGSNPLSPALNETAAKDWTNFVQDGNGAKVFYHFTVFSYSASGGDATLDNEEITFTVTGGTAVVFGVSLENYRWDEANM